MWRYGTPYRYIRFTQHGDNMTLRDEIDAARKDFRERSHEIMTDDDTERIIYRIDGIDDRIDDIEERMESIEFTNNTTGGVIRLGLPPDPEPSEPFPGYNELMKEAIPVLMEAIAVKKREIAHTED